MGVKNYLIEGVSGTGETSVATELERQAILPSMASVKSAYKGDPQTGEPLDIARMERQWMSPSDTATMSGMSAKSNI